MVAQQPAVGRAEQNDRIMQDPLTLKRLQNPSDLVIQVRDAGVVSDLCIVHQRRIGGAFLTAIMPSGLLIRFLIRPVAHERRTDVLVSVHVKIACRRVKRRMRPHERGIKEKGF